MLRPLEQPTKKHDAYDAVALVLPDLTKSDEPSDPEPEQDAGPIDAGAIDESSGSARTEVDGGALNLGEVTPVSPYREGVPPQLAPERFFPVRCDRRAAHAWQGPK